MKSTVSIILISTLMVILAMSVGYSMFTTKLSLNSSTKIIGQWDVRITNVEVQYVSEGCNPGIPEYTNTSVTFNAQLIKPGDFITYEITIKNAGTIDAKLGNIIFKEQNEGSPAINYITTEIKPILTSGEETKFSVTVEYILKTTDVPTVKNRALTGIIEYEQKH